MPCEAGTGKGHYVIEVFETELGYVGVRYSFGFNQVGVEVFDDPDLAWEFVLELGGSPENLVYVEEGSNE